MNKSVILLASLIFLACASKKPLSNGSANTGAGDTRTKQVTFLDDNTYLLTELSTDKTYGYKESNPIKVGGSNESSGPRNERRFLNALLGPNGETVSYSRAGSCCPFKTPNGMINNAGMLDRYLVTWDGSKDTVDIFINMYDKGDLLIPVGFTAKTKK
jgi:hypothetical protein